MTPAGIEPATFRFVAQHLNHCATAVRNLTAVALVLLNDEEIYLILKCKVTRKNRTKYYLFVYFVLYDSWFVTISSQHAKHIERAIRGLIPQSLRAQGQSNLASLF